MNEALAEFDDAINSVVAEHPDAEMQLITYSASAHGAGMREEGTSLPSEPCSGSELHHAEPLAFIM